MENIEIKVTKGQNCPPLEDKRFNKTYEFNI